MIFAGVLLPRHVAIIMDGNGRWARARGLHRLEGHRKGAESVRDVTRYCRSIGIQCLTLYAFSSENWQRPPEEVTGLMQLLRDYLIDERPEIMDNDIRLTAIGRVDKLPPFVKEPLDALRRDSAGNKSMTLCLALSYGGKESILDAVRAALAAGVNPAALDEATLTRHLPTADLPPVDLLVRTSGEQRISNFLLWESAYAELWFTDVLWPEFRREHLKVAFDDFGRRERRFGLTSEQLPK